MLIGIINILLSGFSSFVFMRFKGCLLLKQQSPQCSILMNSGSLSSSLGLVLGWINKADAEELPKRPIKYYLFIKFIHLPCHTSVVQLPILLHLVLKSSNV